MQATEEQTLATRVEDTTNPWINTANLDKRLLEEIRAYLRLSDPRRAAEVSVQAALRTMDDVLANLKWSSEFQSRRYWQMSSILQVAAQQLYGVSLWLNEQAKKSLDLEGRA